MRTTREKTAIVYDKGESFPIGGCKVVRGGSNKDRATIVAAGITLHEALKAVDVLAHEDIPVRVIDLYTVKTIDADTIADAARAIGGRILVVEVHGSEGRS